MANVKEIKGFMKGYRQADAAARDVQTVITHFNDLKPGNESYTHTNGSKEQLCRLKGTIPVTYNGAKYNIPIIIWLLKTHPQQNPVVYVQPTPEMAINPSRYVDGTGRVYLPYLSEWKPPTSDLHTLVQVLSATFAEKIPVYTSKEVLEKIPKNPPGSTSSIVSGGPPRSPPSLPPGAYIPPMRTPSSSLPPGAYIPPMRTPSSSLPPGAYIPPMPGTYRPTYIPFPQYPYPPMAQPIRNSLANTIAKQICPICDKYVDETMQDIIFCNGACQAWLHRQCAGLSAAAFKGLASSTDLYHCPNCRINELSFETLCSELSNMKSKIVQLSEQVSLLSLPTSSDPGSGPLPADDHADPRSGPPPPHH